MSEERIKSEIQLSSDEDLTVPNITDNDNLLDKNSSEFIVNEEELDQTSIDSMSSDKVLEDSSKPVKEDKVFKETLIEIGEKKETRFRNPFYIGQKGGNPNQEVYLNKTSIKEKNRFSDLSIHQLENREKRLEREVKSLEQDYNWKSEEIDDLSHEKREKISLAEERKIERKLDRCRTERESIRQKLEELEKDLSELQAEISEREERRKRRGLNVQEIPYQGALLEETVDITPNALFGRNDPIQNVVLYVASFFPCLNPQDFKRLVSLLLNGRTTSVLTQEIVKSDDGKTQVQEICRKIPLTNIWKESFDQPDKYLKTCFLKVLRQNGSQVVDFTVPSLRGDLRKFLEEEETFYLEEQLRRTQELNLLLDTSNDIAEKALDVSVDAAIDYPGSFSEDWLIGILKEISEGENSRISALLERLSELIYRLQTEPNYEYSEFIVQNFLNSLISSKYFSLSLEIAGWLIDKNLRSGSLGREPAGKILNWLKGILELEEDNELRVGIYALLSKMLWQSGFHLYIYDFLAIFREWLPKKNIRSEHYSLSNNVAIYLLFAYCKQSASEFKLQYYGEWPSVYFLFAPLTIESKSGIDNYDKEIGLLINWLFYTDENDSFSLEYVLRFFDEDSSIDPLEQLGYIVEKWLFILFGFNDVIFEGEAFALAKSLARNIVLNTTKQQRKRLKDFWILSADKYMDEAIRHNQLSDKEMKIKAYNSRKILKSFRKYFKNFEQVDKE